MSSWADWNSAHSWRSSALQSLSSKRHPKERGSCLGWRFWRRRAVLWESVFQLHRRFVRLNQTVGQWEFHFEQSHLKWVVFQGTVQRQRGHWFSFVLSNRLGREKSPRWWTEDNCVWVLSKTLLPTFVCLGQNGSLLVSHQNQYLDMEAEFACWE